MLRNGLGIQQTQSNLDNLSISFKLNGDNYPLCATLMKKAIGGRGKKSSNKYTSGTIRDRTSI